MQKPPNWLELIKDPRAWTSHLASQEVMTLVSKANKNYLHWEKFRFQPMPKGLKPELAWALVKFMRRGNSQVIPIKTSDGFLSVNVTNEHSRDLSFIDRYSSGSIVTTEQLPGGKGKDRLIINGLIEEAISSSQIEGASTTRKVAKAMLELKRKPKNRDEQMIFNNFIAMSKLDDWKARTLDDAFLLELHAVLTQETLDEENEVGRFRNDDDEIVVKDRASGKIVHVPPPVADMKEQLAQLYEFANGKSDDVFLHPFVKASILHFCLGYIHPFVDGNGRSARALFYWYLIKEGYWMFEFLPISLQIKKKAWRPGYDRAYQLTESDEGDVTYFLNYKIKVVCNAIEDFRRYLEKKQREAKSLRQRLVESHSINLRQIEVIEFLQSHPNAEIEVTQHQDRHKVVYQTARTDLLQLAEQKILKQQRMGRRFIFSRGDKFPA